MIQVSEFYCLIPVHVDPKQLGYGTDHEPEQPQLEWWPGDDLVASVPGYLITDRLKEAIDAAGLTGYDLSPVTVERTEKFEEESPTASLPDIYLCDPIGTAYQDDFGLGAVYDTEKGEYFERLVVSSQTMEILESVSLEHAHTVAPVPDDARLRPEAGLETTIQQLFETPTMRNLKKVSHRTVDRYAEQGVEASEELTQLSRFLTRKYDDKQVLAVVEAFDGDVPAAEDTVAQLVELITERA